MVTLIDLITYNDECIICFGNKIRLKMCVFVYMYLSVMSEVA